MANYITKQPLNKGAALSADVQYLMPMVQSEIANIRKRNDMKIAAMENLKQQAQENPDDFRGTQFNFDSDGNMVMNDIAQKMGRVDRDQAIEQQGINTTTETLDMDATKQLTDMNVKSMTEGEAYQNALANQSDIKNAVNPAQLVLDATNQRSYGGSPILNTSPVTKPNQGPFNATTATAPIAKISETPIPFADGMRVATPADYTQPPQPLTDLDKTMAVADKAKDTGLNIRHSEKDVKSIGESKGGSANYEIKTKTGVGDSSNKTEAVKNISTTQMANIVDFDKSNVKQLRRAAGLERVRNLSLGGTPQAPIIGELADRLETREKFLAGLSDTYGVKKVSNTIAGGTTDIKMGNVQAELEARSGASSQSSYHNSMTTGDVSAAGTSGGGEVPGGMQGSVGLQNGTTLQANDTGKKVGNTPILEYKTPNGFNGGYDATLIGQQIKKDPKKALAWIQQVWQGTDTWNKADRSHTIRKGNEYLTLYPDGSFTSNLTQGSARTLLGINDVAKTGSSPQGTSASADASLTNDPNGTKTEVKGKKR